MNGTDCKFFCGGGLCSRYGYCQYQEGGYCGRFCEEFRLSETLLTKLEDEFNADFEEKIHPKIKF